MKNINKIVPFLFLPLLLLMMNCQIEEDVTDKHNRNYFKITDQTFDELILEKKFNNAFGKLPKDKTVITTSLQGRMVMEQQYGFTIVNQPAKVIEFDNRISYTLLITRENKTESNFENLVIEVDSTNHTKAIITEYSPHSNGDNDTVNNLVKITPIIYNPGISTTGKMVITCVTLIIQTDSDCVCGSGTYSTISSCSSYDDESTGGGGTGSGSGGAGSGGTGSGSGNTTTIPVPPVEDVAPTQTPPCKELIKLNKFYPAKSKLMN